MPRRRRICLAVALVLAAGLLGLDIQPSQAVGGERAAILMPFANGGRTWVQGQGPDTHYDPFWGTWAEDLHGPNGTPVQAWFQSSDGVITLKVLQAGLLNCNPSAGSYVVVEVKVDGVVAGKVVYEHLNTLQVSANQDIAVGATLGYLNLWDWGGCWQDTLIDGLVHTHIEAQKGCYRNLNAWTNYPANTAVGLLSSAYATDNSSLCDENDVTAVMATSTPAPPDADADGVADDGTDWCLGVKGTVANRGCPNSLHQVSGDLDGDGKDDVIAVSRNFDNSPGLSWFRSTSTATTTSLADPAPTGLNLPAPAWNVDYLKWMVGDFNGDGKSDLCAASGTNSDAPNLYMFLSDGTGLTGPTLVKQPPSPAWQAGRLEFFAGDYNGDGLDDVIAASRNLDNSPTLSWFQSTSSGMAASLADPAPLPVNLPSPAWNVDNLKWVVGDFDGNHRDDLLAVSGGSVDPPNMYMFLSSGTALAGPTLVKQPPYPGWQWPRLQFMAADPDADGQYDIVAVSRGLDDGPTINWFRSTSSAMVPSLADPVVLASLPSAAWKVSNLKLAMVDVHGDGKGDFFAASGANSDPPNMYVFPAVGSGASTGLSGPVLVKQPPAPAWQWWRLSF